MVFIALYCGLQTMFKLFQPLLLQPTTTQITPLCFEIVMKKKLITQNKLKMYLKIILLALKPESHLKLLYITLHQVSVNH